MEYHLYILYSESRGKYYVGHKGDVIEERVRRHNSNHKGFTGKGDDWRVVYAEAYYTKEQAFARERQIKKWKSTKLIEALFQKHSSAGSEHPD